MELGPPVSPGSQIPEAVDLNYLTNLTYTHNTPTTPLESHNYLNSMASSKARRNKEVQMA